MDLGKYALLPKLMFYGLRAPMNDAGRWNGYWATVHRTGMDGDVLWDAGSEGELGPTRERLREHMDASLPLVELGCGNGRVTRAFAPLFSRAIGVDVAFRAIDRARAESAGLEKVSYRVLDATAEETGARLSAELGDVNVYLRGMLHCVMKPGRKRLLANVRRLLGRRGTLFLIENTLKSNPLDYLVEQGALEGRMPEPLRLCIERGLPPPMRFGVAEQEEYLPQRDWEIRESGPATLHCVPLRDPARCAEIPARFLVARARGVLSGLN